MTMTVDERDWKLFRQRLPGWQERYMERLVNQYTELLASEKKASEKFWELEKRIRKDKEDTGVIAHMSRSMMEISLLNLLREKAITLDDLEGFSEELVERLTYLYNR